jgi:hypothetical protein
MISVSEIMLQFSGIDPREQPHDGIELKGGGEQYWNAEYNEILERLKTAIFIS